MKRFVPALILSLVAGLGLVASVNTASARHWYPGCNCGPIAPTTQYKTIHPAKVQTRYHDTSVYKRVARIHQITNVTRIQPIIRIHDVTRVHHHTIFHVVNAYHREVQHLAPIRYVQRSVQHFYDCNCGR